MYGKDVSLTEVLTAELTNTAAMDVSLEMEYRLEQEVKEPYSVRFIELVAYYKGLSVAIWYKASVKIGAWTSADRGDQ